MAKFKSKKIVKLFSLTIALILVISSFAACGKEVEEEPSTTVGTPTTQATTLPPEPAKVNPLTGDPNYPEELLGNRTIMVSVENHSQARPQWGITSADIVWEMLAEGGISRMLCMFSDASRLPDKIGPTRSARHYFVELAEGFDSILVHFGGSNYGYDSIKAQNTDHIDGMTDNYFYRDKSRDVATEHTAYTTREDIVKAIADKGFRTDVEEGKESPFKFNEEAKTLSGGACTNVTVPFSSGFTYKYNYNAESKLYMSTLNGTPFTDDNGTQQSFTNVIIVYSKVTPLNDGKGRVTYDLTKGSGVYVSNGTYENITWEKGNYTDIMKFYGADGNELCLNPGRSYIALVPTGNDAKIS